ncbi:MAG: hypothetical protein IT243_11625 [Bacteroidia bacterium]|nr:hypothetical protein [Bacteroidia bacterium]
MSYKSFYHIIICCFFFFSCHSKKYCCKKEFTKIKIIYTEDYCGGAAPPDALLAELATPKILKNKEIEVFVSNDIESKPLKVFADTSGTITLPSLKANTIYINLYTPIAFYKDAEKNDNQFYKCYKKFIKDNLIVINLEEKQNDFSVNTLIKCNSCLPPAP